VRSFCRAEEPEKLPVKRPRAGTIALDEPCAWIRRNGSLLLEKQTGSRWRGLWKLPRLVAAPATEPLHTSEYPFTNHRVSLRVFGAPIRGTGEDEAWISLDELEDLPLAAPHRRAIAALLKH
jgi:A/G-specific adenine glycosylase